MPLLNYTTTVTVAKSINAVQAILVSAGARQITTDYDDDGAPSGMAFVVETAYGTRRFMLPVNTRRVLGVLTAQRVQPRYATVEHAERVAWRIVKDWLEAQLAIIETEMVTLDQVMLAYMEDNDGRTVYELYAQPQQALGPGS